MQRCTQFRWAVVGLAVCGLMATGCGKRSADTEEPAVPPLAMVNGEAITEEDFAFELERRLDTGRPIGSAQDVLQELIERRIMLQQAKESSVLDDPTIRRELENQTLVRWLERSLHAKKDTVTVTDEELLAAYDEDIEAFTRPGRTRLAILYRRLPSTHDTGDEGMTAVMEELKRGRQAYLADPSGVTQNGRIPGFGTVAVDFSEHTVSRYRGGDLGWLESHRTDHRWPTEVVQTGFSLEIGEVSDVMVTDEGLYVVMKAGEREAQVTPFEEAAASLRRRLLREKQEAVEATFKDQLLAGAQVEINHDKAVALSVPEPRRGVEPPAMSPLRDRAPHRIAD